MTRLLSLRLLGACLAFVVATLAMGVACGPVDGECGPELDDPPEECQP